MLLLSVFLTFEKQSTPPLLPHLATTGDKGNTFRPLHPSRPYLAHPAYRYEEPSRGGVEQLHAVISSTKGEIRQCTQRLIGKQEDAGVVRDAMDRRRGSDGTFLFVMSMVQQKKRHRRICDELLCSCCYCASSEASTAVSLQYLVFVFNRIQRLA